jgi:signal transduction histidine kinase
MTSFSGLFSHPLRPSLRSRLLLFFSLSLLVPVGVTGAIVFFTVRASLLEASLREQREVAQRLAERVAGQVESAQRGLLTLAAQGGGPRSRPSDRLAALKELLITYPDMMEVSLFDARGRGQIRVARRQGRLVWGPDDTNRARREEFSRASEGRPYIGPVFFTDRDRIPQMFLSASTGAGRGVLLVRLSLHSLWKVVEETETPSMHPAVVDEEGHLLAHADHARVLSHETWGARPELRDFLTGADFPALSTTWGEGSDRRVATFHRVPRLRWAVVVESPRETVLSPARKLGWRILIVVGLLGAMFWGTGLSLVGRILHPLKRLEEGLVRIGQGELSHRLDIQTGDELQRVAEALNGMASSLEVLESTKRDLTHMIVHDLKNPLTGVLGSLEYIGLMAKDNLTPDQNKLVSLGAKSGRELLRMIQNLLDLAKMEEGRLELRSERLSLLELAGQCVDDLEAAILKEKKVISVEVDKNLPRAWADRDLIHRVLANLLTNALKHTPQGTEISIHVRLSEDKSHLVMSVRDNGDGIPLDFQKKIFEKFSQAEGKKQNYRVGSGLGLTFCKMVIEAHQGKIWVDSAPGRGSEFFFTLPMAAPLPVSASATPSTSALVTTSS